MFKPDPVAILGQGKLTWLLNPLMVFGAVFGHRYPLIGFGRGANTTATATLLEDGDKGQYSDVARPRYARIQPRIRQPMLTDFN